MQRHNRLLKIIYNFIHQHILWQTNNILIITVQTYDLKYYTNQSLVMLLVNDKTIKLKQNYQKVLNVYAAFNDTYCFLGIKGHRQDCVVHIDNQGKVLFEKVFEKIMDSFAMMTDRECIMLETRQNCITVLNLQNHEFRRIPFSFMNEQTDQSYIYVFPDTKFICVRQNGRYNDSRFKLSYFQYPLQKDSKPFCQFYSEQDWTYEYLVRKTNNHSQICWFKGRHDQNWEIFCFDLRDKSEKPDPEKCLKKIFFPNKVGEPYGMSKVQCSLKNLWQIRPGQLCLICDTDRTKPEGLINNNYILDMKTGHTRQTKFTFGKYQDYLIDQKYLGPTSMFRTFDFEAGKALPTPVYFINNQTQQIVSSDEVWQCSHLSKYQTPGYDTGMLIQSEYDNGNVDTIRVMTKKIINPRQITMFFMLQSYPDFDADLMQTVTKMIDYSK